MEHLQGIVEERRLSFTGHLDGQEEDHMQLRRGTLNKDFYLINMDRSPVENEAIDRNKWPPYMSIDVRRTKYYVSTLSHWVDLQIDIVNTQKSPKFIMINNGRYKWKIVFRPWLIKEAIYYSLINMFKKVRLVRHRIKELEKWQTTACLRFTVETFSGLAARDRCGILLDWKQMTLYFRWFVMEEKLKSNLW